MYSESYAKMKCEIIFHRYRSEKYWHQLVGEMYEATECFTKEGSVLRRLDGFDRRIAWKDGVWAFEKANMENKYESLAKDIYKWCKQKGLWGDNAIYFNGKAWSSSPEWGGENGKKIDEDLYEYENKNPLTYFKYANPNTLSMSYEGPLNHVLNGYVSGWVKLEEQFLKLFKKYGLYAEYGQSWNLSAYEL